jgi:de-etiolated-1
MAFLFRKAYERADESGGQDVSDISRLRQYYEQLVNLKIWKMQLLDEDYLLLKYSSEEVVTLRAAEPNSQHCLFVIYNIPSTEVIAVFENTTEELVDFFENFADSFRNNNMTVEGRFASSPSNNMYAR